MESLFERQSRMIEAARASNGRLHIVVRPVDVEKDASGDKKLACKMGQIIELRPTKEA